MARGRDPAGAALVRAVPVRRIPLVALVPGLVASTLAVVELAPGVEWTALAAVLAILVAALIRAMRGVDEAARRGDGEAMARHTRLGLLVDGHPQWATNHDLAAWRAAARTDREAARPILRRAAGHRSDFAVYAELAAYGDDGADVAELVEQRWTATPATVRPYLLFVAVAWLVTRGRTADALAIL